MLALKALNFDLAPNIHVAATLIACETTFVPNRSSPTTMSAAGDDPRDASAETKLTFPDSWKTDAPGSSHKIYLASFH